MALQEADKDHTLDAGEGGRDVHDAAAGEGGGTTGGREREEGGRDLRRG